MLAKCLEVVCAGVIKCRYRKIFLLGLQNIIGWSVYDRSKEIFIIDIYKDPYGSRMYRECLGIVCVNDFCQEEGSSGRQRCSSE